MGAQLPMPIAGLPPRARTMRKMVWERELLSFNCVVLTCLQCDVQAERGGLSNNNKADLG